MLKKLVYEGIPVRAIAAKLPKIAVYTKMRCLGLVAADRSEKGSTVNSSNLL